MAHNLREQKICPKCKRLKELSEFDKDRHKKAGASVYCKLCKKEYRKNNKEELKKIAKEWRENNKDKKREIDKRWLESKKEQGVNYNKEYRSKNIMHIKKINKDWYITHKEQRIKYNMEWIKKNPEKRREYARKWRVNNPDKASAKYKRDSARKRSTLKGRLNNTMSRSISMSLKKGVKAHRQWEALAGYTVDQLREHLEKQFTHGMTWENYGQWHIDHKIPISVFNYETPENIDFKKCWALNNLQPMWAKDNIAKKNKLNKPFQPSLAIGIL